MKKKKNVLEGEMIKRSKKKERILNKSMKKRYTEI